MAHLARPADADDLTQETYLRAMRSLPGFRGRSSARTWLLAIARRVAVDQVRQEMRRPRAAAVDDWQAAIDAHQRRRGRTPRFEEMVTVRALLEQLPAPRREALVLTQIVGLSYDEAAQVCACPVGTIRSRVARARSELIQRIRADQSRSG
jgi:RNA polymerase sigma-70 factor (ECF subfamily)